MRRALVADEIKQELADGAVLVLVRGWYWLMSNDGKMKRVNNNSAKTLISKGLDQWKVEAWTGDRVYAQLRSVPWPSQR